MIRSRPLQTLMTRLAWLAIALMLCAPLLSRALQSQALPGLAELCTSAGLKQVDLSLRVSPVPHHADMAKLAGDHAMHGGEAACDYCLLAIRLLPWLLCALLVLAWRAPPRPAAPRAVDGFSGFPWPAHAARGPPRYA